MSGGIDDRYRPIADHVQSRKLRARNGTDAKMATFLACIAAGAKVGEAERRAGAARGMSRYWRHRNPEYRAAYDAACGRGDRFCIVDALIAAADAHGVRDLLAERLTQPSGCASSAIDTPICDRDGGIPHFALEM